MMELDWDPEVDAPATIAILGGGPVGIEAAIYARFLGYFVSIFEAGRVAHRMLDWHDRTLAVPVRECTTSLGHAAILAQNPDYVRRSPDGFYTGRTYANEYLLPLAKTDLLFDDIHFLSPVSDVSRMQSFATDQKTLQERCNDEFRIVVEGRHRGTWISRADVVLDCRGSHQRLAGMGPGGGAAIGEHELQGSFLRFTPLDRKFEPQSVRGKRTCLVGNSYRAAQFANEFAQMFAGNEDTQLIWVVRPDSGQFIDSVATTLRSLRFDPPINVILQEALGVEQIKREAEAVYSLSLLQGDDTVVSIQCDAVCALTEGRAKSVSLELDEHPLCDGGTASFVTKEPGFYVLRAAGIEQGAGAGLADAFCRIRELFALMAGRQDLDLYKIIEQQDTANKPARP
ncbi:MAG: hypothetical protein ABL921_23130 [Pirellula sp.]